MMSTTMYQVAPEGHRVTPSALALAEQALIVRAAAEWGARAGRQHSMTGGAR
jgi:hypothetical protein